MQFDLTYFGYGVGVVILAFIAGVIGNFAITIVKRMFG